MIPIKEIFDVVYNDYFNSAENGEITFPQFNRLSKLAEIRLMDYLNGDVENIKPPMPYTSQKLKDYLSHFITKYPKDVQDGIVSKPGDYYGFENMYFIGNDAPDCSLAEPIETETKYTPINLIDGNEWNMRSKTFIKRLRPSFYKPVCKEVGDYFEFNPKDLGGVVLEYVRYPKFGQIVAKFDPERNVEVIDESASTNYEYGDWARELLVYFISRLVSIGTREDSLLQHTQGVGKLVRDEK